MEVGKYMLFSTYIIHKYTPDAAAQKHVHCCTVSLVYLFSQIYAHKLLSKTSYNLRSPPCGSNMVSFAKEDPEW